MDNKPHRGMTSAALNDDALFVFPADDPYWKSGGNVGRGLYEPEIDWVMLRSVGRPYALIDCGANMGYWSVLASSRPYGQHPVMAIEAAASNFEILLINRQANQNRFSTLHRAVTAQTGDKVRLYGRKHYGMSLRRDWHPADSSEFEEVETITIDEAAGHFPPSRAHPALIKIDVEGSEQSVLRGADTLLSRPDRPAIHFEYNPSTAAQSGESLEAFPSLLGGYKLYYVDDLSGQKFPLGHPMNASALKSVDWLCNLFAVPEGEESESRWASALAEARRRI